MNNLRKLFPALDRRKTDRKVKIDRNLTFEMLERRFAFTADLLDMALDLSDHDHHHMDYYEGSSHELHISNEVIGPFVQQADPVNPDKTLNTATPTTLVDTFKLHSNPGATKRIYLDFDGHVTTGTYWNSDYTGGQSIVSSAFDLDGNLSSFSDAERTRIQLIWERVSEDFIPFNVDVTTEDPGAAALSNTGGADTQWGIRVVIGGGSWWTYGGGGITYVGSFNYSTDTPAFVFPSQLGNGAEKYTAECISHEVGHALGLMHDGRTSPVEEYYSGQGSGNTGWAPIMGNGYYQNLTQWSKGEYLNANNTSEDDLAIITTQNGFSYRNDDRGDTNSTAALLNVSGALISDWGIIERTTDVDAFTFSTGAGTIQINANPLDRGPNLDIFLELYDMANNLVASSNPTDLLSASINVTVTAQQYVLRVSGTGKGNPLTDGYSRYASLGQYFLSGTIISGTSSTLSVVAGDATKAEGNTGSTSYTFVVNRTGDTSGSTTVNYTITGSGSNPSIATDFVGGVLPSGIISFAAGETSKTITVLISGDTTVESDEGFTLTLSNASGSAVITTSSASGLIQNDDTAISVVAGDATKAEGNTGSTSYTFVVSRTGNTSGSTTVNYAITGSGTNPSIANDFAGGILPSGVITFAAGETSKTITVLIVGDTTVESDEGFTLTLSNASGSAVITKSSASGLIQNDDVALSVVAGDASKAEGNTGSTAYTFVVSRTGNTSGSTTVNYAITGSGTNPSITSDFVGGVLPSGIITFAAGETSKTITVLIVGDTTVESDEGFTLTLSNASGSAIITTSSANGLIQNDDTALSVVAGDASKAEGNTGSTAYTFVVSRTGNTSGSTTVNYAITGSGTNPSIASDFVGGVLPSGIITFAAGETSKTITVLIVGDTTVESDEGFTLTLSNASGSTVITSSSASGLIQNDDVALSVVAGNATKAEGNTGSTPYTFVVNRTGDTSGLTTVNYAITGSGTNPSIASDFAGGVLPSGSATFAAGETSKTISVMISGDTSVEKDEGFILTLSNASGSTIITTISASGLIQNDDVSLSVVAGEATKAEGNTGSTPYTFVVSRTGDLSGPTSVDYAIAGSGSNPSTANDFTGGVLPSGSITFAAGESSKTITVLISGDSTVENDEGFTLSLSNATGSTVITTITASGLIQNDDVALSVVAGEATKAEGNASSTPYTFVVSRTGDLSGPTTVDYAIAGSGANPSNAIDFTGGVLPSGSITFAAGETSKTITILISGDTTVENDEGFTLSLSNATGSTVITTVSASGLIQNDDVALSVVAGEATKAEGNASSTPYTFVVSRTGDLSGPTTVDYAIAGSGSNPSDAIDFTGGILPSGSITFAAGETSKTITVLISGDSTVENDEGFTLSLSNATGSTVISTVSASGLTQNDDGSISIVAGEATKAEGNASSTPYTFVVNRSGDTSGSMTVDYIIVGSGSNPSTASDFVGGVLPSGSITFAAGETSKTITVQISGDATVENDEGFTLTLSNATGSTVITTVSASGLIQNDDIALSLVAGSATKAEGNAGSTPYTFVVNRTGDTSGMTTVNYAITGSGTNPSTANDFVGGLMSNGSITFAAGESSKTITILISGDTTVENDEGFNFTLSNASGSAVIATSSATGLIQNDDSAIAVVTGDSRKAEGNTGSTPYTFIVSRTGDTSGSTTVNYAITGSGSNPGTASDFTGGTLPSGSINFAAGETSKTVTVMISGDATIENDEGFTFTLSNASGSTVITTSNASGLIQNDDVALSVVAGDATKAEGNTGTTAYTFIVSRTGDTSSSTTVDYAVTGSGSNPTNASDFADGILPSGNITFAAGESSKTITVLISGDLAVENDEGFALSLSNATGSAVITTISASGLIRNDDVAISVVTGDASKAEGNTGTTAYTFIVNRTGDTSDTTTVDYAVIGSGSNPSIASDFASGILPSGNITFSAGETSKTITVLISADTDVENDESFTLTLSNASGSAVIALGHANGLIQNDDVILSVVTGDAAKTEGNTGSTPYTFVVNRTGDTSGSTTVDYAVSGSGSNPTNATDFAGGILPSGSITLAAGETSKTITVLISGDSNFESNESFTVTLSNASGAAVISGSSANGLIQNDDVENAFLAIVAENATKAEGNSGSTPFTFVVNRTGNTIGSTTVNYAVIGSGSNPSAASDFTGGVLPKGVITFAAGETSKTINILILGDTTLEKDEGFTVTLSNASGTSIITGVTANGLIQNDEVALSVVAGSASKVEGSSVSTPYTFVVSRAGNTNVSTTVDYAVTGSGSNPCNASDFEGGSLPSGSIAFAAGETSKTITVMISSDTDVENNEGFSLTLSNASGSAAFSRSSATGLIQNDDIAISVVADSATKAEGNSGTTPYTFVVYRTGNTNGATTVNYAVVGSGSNPSNASDFAGGILPGGSITFAYGETSKTIAVLVSGDSEFENDEGFTLVLSNASGTSVITTSSASGMIQNDEVESSLGTGNGSSVPELIKVSSTKALATKESRTRDSFTVVLKSKPTADVTIQVKSLDTTEGTVDKNQLRFTPARWNVPQTVFVTGVDDTIRDGDITYVIDLSSAISTDPTYNGREVSDVWVTNQDNEKGMIQAAAGLAISDFKGASESIDTIDTIMAQVAASNSIGVSSSQASSVATLSNQSGASVRSLALQSNLPSQALAMSEMTSRIAVSNGDGKKSGLISDLARVDMDALDKAFSNIENLLNEFAF